MKKGFTIVELMASIVIIGVISLLGVSTYQRVSKNIKEQQYENKVTLIESKAALFASDTGYLLTNVQELVEEGYLEADNEKGEVISPKDNKTLLNDNIVTITREGENFYGHFTADTGDINETDRTNINMEIIVKNLTSGETIEVGKWTNQDVILTANITINDVDYTKVRKITWYNGAIKVASKDINNDFNSQNTIEVTASQIMNTNYRVEVELESGDKTTYYQAIRIIRIDKQKPIVYQDDIKVENADIWTKDPKKVTILGTDQNGSGIAGYYISKNENCSDDSYKQACEANKKCNAEKYEDKKGNGTYYVCAKDSAGNKGTAVSFKVEKIDDVPPTCTILIDDSYPITVGNNGWYRSDIHFKIDTSDGLNSDGTTGSGVQSKQMNLDKIDFDTTGAQIKGVVRDKAGNKGECIYNNGEFVRRDITPPSCRNSGDKTNWTKGTLNLSYGCADTLSGCLKGAFSNCSGTLIYNNVTSYGYCQNTLTFGENNTEYATRTIAAYTIYDAAGNPTTCGARNASVYLDNKAPSAPTITSYTYKNGEKVEDYYGNKWVNLNVYTKASGSVDNGIKGVSYYYSSKIGEEEDANYSNVKRFKKAEEQGHGSITYEACDALDNCSRQVTLPLYIDKTKPTCDITVSGKMKVPASGWYTSDVSLVANGHDDESYVASAIVNPTSITSDTGGTEVTAAITDAAGNTETCTKTVKRDTEAPTVSCSYSEGGNANEICAAAGQGPLDYYYLCDYSDLSGTATRNVTWGGSVEIEEKGARNNANGAAIDPDTLCMKTKGAGYEYAVGSLCDYAGNCR